MVGLPGSGKTTLIARLLNRKDVEELLKACASTGIMDDVIVCIGEDKALTHSISTDSTEWEEEEFRISCLRQISFDPNEDYDDFDGSDNQTGSIADHSGLKSDNSLERHGKPAESAKQSVLGGIDLSFIRNLLKKEGFSAVLHHLDNKKCTLYISDTGGQIEFQEILPLLVAGRAIFIFVFPLHIDLDKPVKVCYRMKMKDEVNSSNAFISSLTIKDSFLQTLASIDSMESSTNEQKSHVFVVGTHKDLLIKKLGDEEAEKKIRNIDSEIKSLVENHGYQDLVLYNDKNSHQVLFDVDNTTKNSIFQKIRSHVMNLMSRKFEIEFPLSYLLASLELDQHYKTPFITRKEFVERVAAYKIEEKDVDHLLKFLHGIGQICHFPIESIKETIVREPQALYNVVTKIIIRSFLREPVSMADFSEEQKGIYSLDAFKMDESYLTPKEVTSLLKELRIVAPFTSKAGVEKYFIPCILNHLKESPENDKSSPVQPLAVMFECGHCPKGIFGVLLHYLVIKGGRLEWRLNIKKIFREQVSFEVGPYGDVITLKFCTTHLQVSYHPVEVAWRDSSFSLEGICNAVRSTLALGIEQATVSLHYDKEKTQHAFGLVCGECGACLKVMESRGHHMISKCSQQGYQSMPQPGSYWFGCKLNAATNIMVCV